MARGELSRHGVAVALDYIGEARNVCLEALPGIQKPEVTELFRRQAKELAEAEMALRSDRLGTALQALKRVGERAP
jgi:hypothetical protein